MYVSASDAVPKLHAVQASLSLGLKSLAALVIKADNHFLKGKR